jgi:hypothetical protein
MAYAKRKLVLALKKYKDQLQELRGRARDATLQKALAGALAPNR